MMCIWLMLYIRNSVPKGCVHRAEHVSGKIAAEC